MRLGFVAGFVLSGLISAGVTAGELVPLVSSASHVTGGWTSNATETPGGPSDTYVEHRHDISFAGGQDGLALRGRLSLSQTRFVSTDVAEDEFGAGIEGEMLLAPGVTLRLGYALDHKQATDGLPLGGGILPVDSAETRQEVGGQVTVARGTETVTLSLVREGLHFGPTRIGSLPPMRMTADAGVTSLEAEWRHALGGGALVLAGGRLRFTGVGEEDRLLFERFPAHDLRMSFGLGSEGQGNIAALARGGLDVVWPDGRGDLAELQPFAEFLLEARFGGFAAALEAGTEIELIDPVDGVAGTKRRLGIELVQALMPGLDAHGGFAHEREKGIYDPASFIEKTSLSAGLRYRPDTHWSYGLAVTRTGHSEQGLAYRKTDVALTISGAI